MVLVYIYSWNKDVVCNFGGVGLFIFGRIWRGRFRFLIYLFVLYCNKKEVFVGIDEGCLKSLYIYWMIG